ncbi:glycosyltransferase family 2 protein [Fictibacillus fluitans]|uniref:Glycosyltransferase family 2 protein n=1 Tax=Fictibacillus fluitans TaxID=3058422 RepID=A0ABT8I127_9BACL|nr:glycosyltransferase family 2 protein [Fictibacillus sp. NE201]MDN4526725.1 glycosyltransferase family 2 protein [Fictibacillus sp. NE201]
MDKVSMVIPIYKVEKYIHRCVKSVLGQTYTNLEVILVNDGSPDQCGKIADEYQKKDPRVKVIHKENGGLSDARNAGMKLVTGDYTLFVDSDDWLDTNMVKVLVNYMLKYKADAVQAAFFYAHDDHLLYDNRYYAEDDPPILFNRNSLMKELVINEKVKNFAWGKLFKTSMINDLPFKKGVLFEDVFWTHLVMDRIQRYVMIHQPLYYYYQREDSIVSSYSPKNLDIIKGLKERHEFIEKKYSDLKLESYKLLLKTSIIHYWLLMMNNSKDKDKYFRKMIHGDVKLNYSHFFEAVKEDKDLRYQLFLFSIHPNVNMLYVLLKKAAEKYIKRTKQLQLKKIDL